MTTTRTDTALRALHSLFVCLERIEDEPHRAVEIARLRHLSAVKLEFIDGDRAVPIESVTLRCELKHPHPLSTGGVNDGSFVGDVELHERFTTHHECVDGHAGYRVVNGERVPVLPCSS